MLHEIAQMRQSINLWGSPKDFSKFDELVLIGEGEGFTLSGRTVVDLKPSKDHNWVTHIATNAVYYGVKKVSEKVYGACTPELFIKEAQCISIKYEQKLKDLDTKDDNEENLLKELVLLLKTACLFRAGINNIDKFRHWPILTFGRFQRAIMGAIVIISKSSWGVEHPIISNISFEKLGFSYFCEVIDLAMTCQGTELVAMLLKQLNVEQLTSFIKTQDSEGNNYFHRMAKEPAYSDILIEVLKTVHGIAGIRNGANILPIEIVIEHQNDPELLVKFMIKVTFEITEIKEWAAVLSKAVNHQTEANLALLLPWFPPGSFRVKGIKGDTPLHSAARRPDLVGELLAMMGHRSGEEGVSIINDDEETVFHLMAKRADCAPAMKSLIKMASFELLFHRKQNKKNVFEIAMEHQTDLPLLEMLLKMFDAIPDSELWGLVAVNRAISCEIGMEYQTDLLLLKELKEFGAKLFPDATRWKISCEIPLWYQSDLPQLEELLKGVNAKLLLLPFSGLLHLAARYQSVKNLEILVSYFPQISFFQKNRERETPLEAAVKYHPEKLGAAMVLLRNSEDYDVTLGRPKGRTRHEITYRTLNSLFEEAWEAQELNFLKNLNNHTHCGWGNSNKTLLHMLIDENKFEQVKVLLEIGADPYLYNTEEGNDRGYSYYWSPYDRIMENQNHLLSSIKHIKEGHDQLAVDAKNASNQALTQLFNAIYHGDMSAFLKAMDMGIEIDELEGAIYLAARRGRADILKILLEKDLDSNVKDENGFSPIKVAAIRRDTEVLDILSKHEKIDKVDLKEANELWWRFNGAFSKFVTWAKGYTNEKRINRADYVLSAEEQLFLIYNLEPISNRIDEILKSSELEAKQGFREELENNKETKNNEIAKMLIKHLPPPEVRPNRYGWGYY